MFSFVTTKLFLVSGVLLTILCFMFIELLKLYANPALVSLLSVLLWVSFFYFYSPRRTVRVAFLLVAFFLGLGSALLSIAMEQVLFFYYNINISFLNPLFKPSALSDLVRPIIFSFLFAAIIEETSKFSFIRKYFEVTSINQVIDGMKVGLIMGLGFAFIENIIYFTEIFYYSTLAVSEITAILLLRGVFSTLAHGIYGIVMGYYLSLGKFYEKLHTHFIWRALIASILIHGLFNFFLIINLGFYSIFMLAFLTVVALVWYHDRKNLELRIVAGDQTLVVPPFLAEKLELEVWKSKHASRAEYLDRLWNILLEAEEKGK